MESEKHNNFGDQQEKSIEEEARIGRSYDCNFCKRGFTNAQALGGHMNIHRKDKAKTNNNNKINSSKEPSSSSSSSISPRLGLVSNELVPHFPGATHHQTTTYQVYLPPPPIYYQHGYQGSGSGSGQGHHVVHEDHNPFDYQGSGSGSGRGNQVVHEDHNNNGGLNLSLNFGTPSHVDRFGETRKEIEEDSDEVDLELRLGNHYYYR